MCCRKLISRANVPFAASLTIVFSLVGVKGNLSPQHFFPGGLSTWKQANYEAENSGFVPQKLSQDSSQSASMVGSIVSQGQKKARSFSCWLSVGRLLRSFGNEPEGGFLGCCIDVYQPPQSP